MPDPETLPRREWCYTQAPEVYGIDPCKCGAPTEWSEFKDRLWCPVCQIDFKPPHWGVFDGPILLELANLLGMRFDRFIIATQTVELQDLWVKPSTIHAMGLDAPNAEASAS